MDGSTRDPKKAVAQVAELMAEGAMLIRATKHRLVKTTSGRVVSTGEIVKALVEREKIETAAVSGKALRPETILCVDCKRVVKVRALGPVPQRCAAHTVEHEREKERRRKAKMSAAQRAKHNIRVADMTPEQLERNRERRRIRHMTPEQLERQRARKREKYRAKSGK